MLKFEDEIKKIIDHSPKRKLCEINKINKRDKENNKLYLIGYYVRI